MEWLRSAVDCVKDALQGEALTPVERLLDLYLPVAVAATTMGPRNAIPIAVMNDLASRTKNIVDYPFIMERIWLILIDYQCDPTLMHKVRILTSTWRFL